jgi:16S rRNA (cytidine1402-2'-O)-methyltransferase
MAEGILYLIPTVLAPDTQDAVLPPLVREVVQHTQYYWVENLRTARRFISSLRTGVVIDTLHFEILDKRSKADTLAEQLATVPPDASIGIMSEAGCPGIADPGALAVRWAHEQGRKVVPLTGPSSIVLALIASGFQGQRFAFEGYLPIDAAERGKRLRQLEQRATREGQTQIFMETPYRNQAMLQTLLHVGHPQTLLCIACNLTAPDGWVRTKTLEAWKAELPNLHKLPCIFVMGE